MGGVASLMPGSLSLDTSWSRLSPPILTTRSELCKHLARIRVAGLGGRHLGGERRGTRVCYLVGDRPDCLSAPALLWYLPDLAERDVYLCGPPGMADVVRTWLAVAGLPAGQLHEERFSW